MGLKVDTTCLQWSQPIATSCSLRRRRRTLFVYKSSIFGAPKLYRSRSFEYRRSQVETIKRSCSFDGYFNDEEVSRKIKEIALRFEVLDDSSSTDQESEITSDSRSRDGFCLSNGGKSVSIERPWLGIPEEPLIIPGSIERKANSVDLPLSLRMLKRKLQWQVGLRDAGKSACCSVTKAFSSMVFIIRELHSFTLQMRGRLLYEDFQGIIVRVQKEMQDSFVWLFQQVFSHTPTLMVYLMVLLANFTVHSMSSNAALLMPPLSTTDAVVEIEEHNQPQFDSSTVKSFLISSSGKTASIGGNNGGGGGGGGRPRPIASGTDGEGMFNRSEQLRKIVPDGASKSSSAGNTKEDESVSNEEEVAMRESIIDEATEMQSATHDESLDQDTTNQFISPIRVNINDDDYADYSRTELMYHLGLSRDPNDPLLLTNYAQFLYVVAHDFERAEEYFEKAIRVEPPDAEAYSKYGHFLWKGKKDLWAAEEKLLEALSAEPGNNFYGGSYANFLWTTGGEETCYPLSSPNHQIIDPLEA